MSEIPNPFPYAAVPCLPDFSTCILAKYPHHGFLLLFSCINFNELFSRWNLLWAVTCLHLFLDHSHLYSAPEQTPLLPFWNGRCFTLTIQSVLQRRRLFSHSHFIGKEAEVKLVPWQAPQRENWLKPASHRSMSLPYLWAKQWLNQHCACSGSAGSTLDALQSGRAISFLSGKLSKSSSQNKTPRIIFADFCGVIFGQHPGTGNHSCS